MVYTRIFIIKGILLTRDQVLSTLDLPEDPTERGKITRDLIGCDIEEKFKEEVLGEEGNLRLYSFPCCSESNGQLFILGMEVHCIYRRYKRCKDCEKHSLCDKCIGETAYGRYDVDSILSGPVRVDSKKMCWRCDSDQMRKKKGRCKVCHSEFHSGCPKGESWVYPYAKKAVKQMGFEKEPVEHFYMLDDCLSCT